MPQEKIFLKTPIDLKLALGSMIGNVKKEEQERECKERCILKI